MLTYGSVCSGVEAASVAWEPLGWKPSWFSEIEAFPSAVLAHRWPSVMNLGDMTNLPNLVRAGAIVAPDVIVGGTPCQAFSVAGVRNSMGDERGALTLKYVELINANDEQRKAEGLEPTIVVWENVPGVLSTKDNAFGCFLAGLAGEDVPLEPSGGKWTHAGCVFGPQRAIAWRTLDAQYFGLAQRRKRVFVIASAREGFDPTKVLFEFEGMRRDSPPRREARQDAPSFTEGSFGKFNSEDVGGTVRAAGGSIGGGSETLSVLSSGSHVTGTLMANQGDKQFAGNREAFSGDYHIVEEVYPIHDKATRHSGGGSSRNNDGSANGLGVGKVSDPSPTVTAGDKHAVCYENHPSDSRVSEAGDLSPIEIEPWGTGGGNVPLVLRHLVVRRLTPIEVHRLQGFSDNHCRIPWRKKPAELCPDGPQYKAMGNSMPVNVMRWIGVRIMMEAMRCLHS